MSIGDLARSFSKAVPRLIDKAHELGYEVTLGDSYRDPRLHGDFGERAQIYNSSGELIGYGRAFSCHKLRCAIDLNLYKRAQRKDGTFYWKYCTTTEDHRELGEWWEQTFSEAAWGGRFDDANHYSFRYQGYR